MVAPQPGFESRPRCRGGVREHDVETEVLTKSRDGRLGVLMF